MPVCLVWCFLCFFHILLPSEFFVSFFFFGLDCLVWYVFRPRIYQLPRQLDLLQQFFIFCFMFSHTSDICGSQLGLCSCYLGCGVLLCLLSEQPIPDLGFELLQLPLYCCLISLYEVVSGIILSSGFRLCQVGLHCNLHNPPAVPETSTAHGRCPMVCVEIDTFSIWLGRLKNLSLSPEVSIFLCHLTLTASECSNISVTGSLVGFYVRMPQVPAAFCPT